ATPAERVVRRGGAPARGAAVGRMRGAAARRGRAAAGERRPAVAAGAQSTRAIPLALARQRLQRLRTPVLAPPPARGRAGARAGVAGPRPGMVAAGLAPAAAGPGAARGLPAAGGEACDSPDPGAPAPGGVDGQGRGGMSEVVVHTDGACLGNPGPGGWAALLRYGERERELVGGEPDTTNNRMELMAAIMALETLSRPCDVVLHTDSQYVRQGITQWLPNWVRRGWKP